MFETWVKPGELAPLHRHPDHGVYVLQGGRAMLYSKDFPGAEKGMAVEFKTGDGLVNGPITDSARNIGNTTIKLLELDVHRPETISIHPGRGRSLVLINLIFFPHPFNQKLEEIYHFLPFEIRAGL